ncbi:putative fluoride ion transporter CrcB [Sphingomonas sp. S2M10]|uniref:fluoride efflux transporter CrcB n=1 Tax=Sphingomonas sp. S2M10 TaxID=2705010 RepID=UPI001456C623|nr:fluoride efflux transporter CrcB [Sphingomonas sp. S2M10]NLS26065.1 putative fluoride ion transporter CrcB [Sphingomonas sp. S2M10]
MPNLFLVMLGGAIGSAARYGVGRAGVALLGPAFPWGTLAVNVVGGLLMGLLGASLLRFGPNAEQARLLLGVGLLGGFTTFSSFSLETFAMIERGEVLTALAYVLASVIGAIGAVAIGMHLARAVTA